MSKTEDGPTRAPWLDALIAATPVFLAGGLGNLATIPNIPTWYASLNRPPLTPPNWVFGPVWTILYAMMGYALYRILRLDPATPGRGRALVAFMAQLTLNAAWSFAFFGANSPSLGLMTIVPLLTLIVATILIFRPLDSISARCLMPYAGWVCFATYLNAGFWWFNR
jgi:benzodiazapine receptor